MVGSVNWIHENWVNVLWLAVIVAGVGWLALQTVRQSTDPLRLIIKWIVTAVILGFIFKTIVPGFAKGGGDAIAALILMLLCGGALNIIWRHSLIEVIAKPFSSLYDGGTEPPEPKPYYSIAIAKRKKSQPVEAVAEIRRQLAKFPNDFEGVMLLASVQAEDMQDLPGAEITLNNFCNSPDAPPKQFAAAMSQLADWHLKLMQDADGARAALQKIVEKFPDTELSLRSAQRIAHLGGTEKILLAAHDRPAMAVPEGVKNVGLLDSSEFLQPQEVDSGKLAAVYVKHLDQHPHDTEIREKLALIYADHFQRLDLATAELVQMINEPNQPPKRVAHWLNVLADLQVKHGGDYDLVRQTLERIVEAFPGLPAGDIARMRLARLKLEFKGQQKESPGVKLGDYEQNIGLKYGTPFRAPRKI